MKQAKPVTVVELLKNARKLLAKSGWTQNVSARDSENCAVSCIKDRAVSFCALGAVWRSASSSTELNDSRLLKAQYLLSTVTESSDITVWNDVEGRRKKDVLAAYDKAIKLAEKEGL